jgi:hypothetical protein
MPEQIMTHYGKIGEGRTGILEMQFDKNVWECKEDGNILRMRRKGM